VTISKTQRSPSLPFGTVQYDRAYQDQLNNILRIYFNSIDSTLDQIITLLNNGGYFPSLDVGTVNADTVNAPNINAYQILATYAALQNLSASGIQGGNIVGNNITGSKVNASLFTGLGAEITLPHIGASDTTAQYADANNDPTIVKWNTLDAGFGFSLASNAATATYDGTYKIDFSLQFVNTDNNAHEIVMWLKVNGNDVVNSASKVSVPARKSGGVFSYVLAYSTVPFVVSAGDVIELWWATDKAYNPTGPVNGVYMEFLPAQTSPYAHPAIPSAIGTITYMSAPQPPLIRVTPIGPVGTGAIGSVATIIRNNT
jgi:hypothetical protein